MIAYALIPKAFFWQNHSGFLKAALLYTALLQAYLQK